MKKRKLRCKVEPGTWLSTFKNCSKRYNRKTNGIRQWFTTEELRIFLMKMKNICPGYDVIPVKICKSFSKHKKGMGILMDNLIKNNEGKLILGIKKWLQYVQYTK